MLCTLTHPPGDGREETGAGVSDGWNLIIFFGMEFKSESSYLESQQLLLVEVGIGFLKNVS